MNVPAGWTRLIALIGLLILVVVVAHWLVRRKGAGAHCAAASCAN